MEIWAQGADEELSGFLTSLKKTPPERASIMKIETTEMGEASRFESFEIVESEKEKGEIFVSPDIAICPKCKKELFDRGDRRYLHPFINCTDCGPRLTILDSMPYDRVRTSMGEFEMCGICLEEYTHPATRRYDAQPVCCNDCGPKVYILGGAERGASAITRARWELCEGGIVAVKGIGGFHLCCNATDEGAVRRLRALKARPAKPFAVMMRDMAAVHRECRISEAQEKVLDGHQKPIVLLEKRAGGMLCGAVAPENPNVGVMLPYAPLQLLLFDYDDGLLMPDCLVMTSGNISGAPICRSDKDAAAELSGLCDVILSHDRKIRLRADDSVMDFYKGRPYMIRRSRGYAPLPVMLSGGFKGQVLAVGGELKNTFCIGKDNFFYQSPYIGDMEDLRTVKALRESIARMATLLEASPSVVACDMHPKYNTSAVAVGMGIPVVYVQHHYAHILSCMAENDCAGPVIGVSFDGTGYGTDGTVWGGELLTASYDGFERVGHIKPFSQIGGDASAKEGWRIAVSMIYGICKDRDRAAKTIKELGLCDEKNCAVQLKMADKGINAVKSTSAGRLFDAVSAILGIRRSSSFEGEASMALEFAAERYERRVAGGEKREFPCSGWQWDERTVLPTDALVESLVRARLEGGDAELLAYVFHRELANMAVEACAEISAQSGIRTAALSGGVYQNKLLLKMTEDGLKKQGFTVLTHSLVPPNDGGIALGQAVAAMRKIERGM